MELAPIRALHSCRVMVMGRRHALGLGGQGMTERKLYDVIVIGGGFAGLIATRDLKEKGKSVLLLEARDRLGGRAYFQTFPGTDKQVELGGTWVMPQYMKEVGREIERYGWQLAGSEVGPLKFLWHFGDEDEDAFPISPDERYAFERALFQIGLDARRIDTSRPRDKQDLADLDISVADYLKRMDLPQRVYDLISAYARIGSGAAVEDWSALMALSLVAAYDNSPYAWFASVTTRFRDGTAEPVATLAAGAETVRLNSVVTSIEQTAHDIAVTLASGERYAAGAAVLAVPVTLWSTIAFSPPLNVAKRDAAERGHAGRMGKVWIMVDNLEEDISSFGGDTDLLLLQTEYRLPGRSILVGFTSPPNLIDVADHQAVVRAVHQHVPSANVIATFAHDWSADPFARGAWVASPVGQLSRHATGLRSPEGRLSFAGSDLAMRWIGWIDGAIETGHQAADEAAAHCGQQ